MSVAKITLELVDTLELHSDTVWCCSWSFNGKLLATASADHSVRIWQKSPIVSESSSANCSLSESKSSRKTTKFECVQRCEGHTRTVRCISWNPNNRLFASASFDSSVLIWEFSRQSGQFECVEILDGHDNEVKSIAWNPAGELLASCSRDKSVWLWEMKELDFEPVSDVMDEDNDGDVGNVEFEVGSVLNKHEGDVKCVKWSVSDDCLWSGSYDDTVRVWVGFGDDYYCSQTLKGHRSTVWCIDGSPMGAEFISSSANGSLLFWKRDAENESISTPGMVCFQLYQRMDELHNGDLYRCQWIRAAGFDFVLTCGADSCIRVLGRIKRDSEWSVLFTDDHSHEQFEINWVECSGVRIIVDEQSDSEEKGDDGAAASSSSSVYQFWVATACDDAKVRIFQLDLSDIIQDFISQSEEESGDIQTLSDELLMDDETASVTSSDLDFVHSVE